MTLIGRNVRKFTTAESFQLFMEGLRSLQLYDEEAAKDCPDAAILKVRLKDAAGHFEECVGAYPNDILPRYYRATVLSIQGQVEQALLLQNVLQAGAPVAEGVTGGKAEPMFQQAAAEFGETASRAAGGDLLLYAEYNQAQMLAKLSR